MRTLKYAILGLLNQNKLTGYDLMQQFESTLNEFWSAKHSQIYPELKKLTAEGMIEFEVEISGTSLEKKVYSITEAGRKDFLAWLCKDEALHSTPKDTFRLRTFYSNYLSDEQREHFFTYQLNAHRFRLNHLKENYKKFDQIPLKDSPEFGDYLVLMGAIMREENIIQWIEKCIELYN